MPNVECPSQVLRHAAAHWYQTYRNVITGLCGKPKRKKKDVIKKRAITFILHSGTELSAKGVLVPPRPQVDTGRAERSKTSLGQAQSAVLNETSKKKVKRQHTVALA
jgi:hypothetical protein